MAAVSCNDFEDVPLNSGRPTGGNKPNHYIVGRVLCWEHFEPLEHIKITVDWGEKAPQDIKYTADDGSFTVEIPSTVMAETVPVTITLEDIDEYDNSGLFETISDSIIISLDPESSTGILDYRLHHATASESSPQS